MGFRLYRRALIEENKWRAARWGIDGQLIDFGKKAEVPMRDLALELLDFVDDVVDELGSREHVNYVHTILRDGTSADRQLTVYRETGDLQGRRPARRSRDAAGRDAGLTAVELDGLGQVGSRWCQRAIADRVECRVDRGTAWRSEKSDGPMVVGLLCGREFSFPPAFIDGGQRAGASSTASPPRW